MSYPGLEFNYCPHCAERMTVVESRPKESFMYRRRYCPECDYKVSTAEVKVSKKQLKELRRFGTDCVVVGRAQLTRLLDSLTSTLIQLKENKYGNT